MHLKDETNPSNSAFMGYRSNPCLPERHLGLIQVIKVVDTTNEGQRSTFVPHT